MRGLNFLRRLTYAGIESWVPEAKKRGSVIDSHERSISDVDMSGLRPECIGTGQRSVKIQMRYTVAVLFQARLTAHLAQKIPSYSLPRNALSSDIQKTPPPPFAPSSNFQRATDRGLDGERKRARALTRARSIGRSFTKQRRSAPLSPPSSRGWTMRTTTTPPKEKDDVAQQQQ